MTIELSKDETAGVLAALMIVGIQQNKRECLKIFAKISEQIPLDKWAKDEATKEG